ncbi:hypothetical protein SLS59_005528 [Nothophoma quercina]|uniref:Uncharacterized protein n=1 Tax=Nothophoma quercina TaxID=749835 RepID=A0ABR3RA93_9PLEO
MAPKRPLYGDLSAAHAGIVRRAEDSFDSSILDLPLPPTPAAISPGSSTYTSPIYSPESHFAPSPLAVKKAPNESRFSIKQLTRTLTKRLTKPQEHDQEEELQQFRDSNASGLSISVDEEPLQPLEQTYIPADRTSYFPISPVSPTSPTSPPSRHDLEPASDDDDDDIEYAQRDSGRSYESQGLTSMIPDDPSTQVGRAGDFRSSTFAMDQGGRPYYDDLASIYASSSVYTGDDRRKSAYQQSLAGNRQSNPFLRYSGMDAVGIANEYSYSNLSKNSRPVSRPLTQELYHRSVVPGDGKTDTISKFIDQYDPGNMTTNSLSTQNLESANTSSLIAPYTIGTNEEPSEDNPQQAPLISGLNQFQFKFNLGSTSEVDDYAQPTLTKERVLNRQPGLPPAALAPLAPAFHYDQPPYARPHPDFSEMFSKGSQTSYGDTRNLLQLSQSEAGGHSKSVQDLQPSSSYSQPEIKALAPSSSYSQPEGGASPQTPQEALDQAEQIFDEAANFPEPSQEDIPAMWGRRSSVNLLRSKRLTDGSVTAADAEKADWETVADDDQQGRQSLDSIADYSSSEGSRNSLDATTERDKETQELLASGPNDDILFDSEIDPRSRRISYKFKSHGRVPESSSPRSGENDGILERENTFDKFTVVGPKGNLTGTPHGTGMHDAGSSVADNSSPGVKLSSPRSPHTDYCGFYASPYPATGSVTRIRPSTSDAENQHGRTSSQVTLFPSVYSIEPVQGSSPLAGPDRRRSLRHSTTFKPARRASRAAVPGQTKLRQMVLAPDARTTVSSQDTHFSRFVSVSGRPSTSDTATPLHPTHPSLDTFPTIRSGKTILAHQHSPHLLCPEREPKEEDEVRRRKLSWLIFACFCILPPCMFLYRVWGDSIIVSVTKGELGHCTAESKRAALIAGIVVNIGLVTAILVPILVAQALKAI